jgi:nitrite reductase (NADH) large subunit
MRTSDPRIYAAGDVVDFENRILGLWPASMEHARVAVVNLLGGEYLYKGTAPPTRLKVAGIDLRSVGDIAPQEANWTEVRVDDRDGRQYRKLVLSEGRIRGAVLIGHAELADALAAAVEGQRDVNEVLPRLERGDWSALLA